MARERGDRECVVSCAQGKGTVPKKAPAAEQEMCKIVGASRPQFFRRR